MTLKNTVKHGYSEVLVICELTWFYPCILIVMSVSLQTRFTYFVQ